MIPTDREQFKKGAVVLHYVAQRLASYALDPEANQDRALTHCAAWELLAALPGILEITAADLAPGPRLIIGGLVQNAEWSIARCEVLGTLRELLPAIAAAEAKRQAFLKSILPPKVQA